MDETIFTFRFDGTNLCIPNNQDFHNWLAGRYELQTSGLNCEDLPDLSITAIPVQVLEGYDLATDKETAVKVVVRKTGNFQVNDVSVRSSFNGFTSTQFFVYEPANLDAQHALQADNSEYSLSFLPHDITKTIYFFSDQYKPSGETYNLEVAVDYLGQIIENNEMNNTARFPWLSVSDTQWTGQIFPDFYVHYFRTDWDDTPITQFDNYYQYSNRFLLGTYPVAEARFDPDYSSNYVGAISIIRGDDGLLNADELGLWVRATLVDMRLAHLSADRFVSSVPEGWFVSNTTGGLTEAVGVAYPSMRELVVAEISKVSYPNGPSIVAHEIGHSYGLHLECEDYDEDCDDDPDRIGTTVEPGIWIEERIPMISSGDREIYSFMGAYSETAEFWAKRSDYAHLFQEHETNQLWHVDNLDSEEAAILATGIFSSNGTVTLDNWYTLSEAEISTLSSGPYSFEYRNAVGTILYQQDFDVLFNMEGINLNQSPFVYTIPYIPGAASIHIKQGSTVLAEKTISANARLVTLLSPNGGVFVRERVFIRWSGSDIDRDKLTYALFYSSDGGTSWEPIASNLTGLSYKWDSSNLPVGSDYVIKVIVTDGFLTGEDSSKESFSTIDKSLLYLPAIAR